MEEHDELTPLRIQELAASRTIKGKIDSTRMNAPRLFRKLSHLPVSFVAEMTLMRGRHWTKSDRIFSQKLSRGCGCESDFFE